MEIKNTSGNAKLRDVQYISRQNNKSKDLAQVLYVLYDQLSTFEIVHADCLGRQKITNDIQKIMVSIEQYCLSSADEYCAFIKSTLTDLGCIQSMIEFSSKMVHKDDGKGLSAEEKQELINYIQAVDSAAMELAKIIRFAQRHI